MPVEVVTQSADSKIYREETLTLAVTAHGARLVLTTESELEPSLLVINKKTSPEGQCRVMHQEEIESEKAELGIEFAEPQACFWGIAFPMENRSRAKRKMPAPTCR